MVANVLWRWMLLGLLRNPWVTSLWLVLALWVPSVERLRPFSTSQGALQVALEGVFPAGMLGVLLGLERLSRGTPFLTRLGARTRWAGEFGALLTASFYLQVPILLGSAWAATEALDFGRVLPGILTADLRLASVALLLLIPRLSTSYRTSLFLCGVWVLPALCAQGGLAARAFGSWLDAGQTLRAHTGTSSLTSIATGSALTIVGYLLRTGPACRTPS